MKRNEIKINTILVSCEDKSNLVRNCIEKDKKQINLLKNGIIGYLKGINPKLKIISSGGTYKLLKKAGYNVIAIEEYTDHPQMKNGLVKSIDYKIHASILAEDNDDDNRYLIENNLLNIDCVITNFSSENLLELSASITYDEIVKKIDIGGPLMCLSARKALNSTLLLTDPHQYSRAIADIEANHGFCSIQLREYMALNASKMNQEYFNSVDTIIKYLIDNSL